MPEAGSEGSAVGAGGHGRTKGKGERGGARGVCSQATRVDGGERQPAQGDTCAELLTSQSHRAGTKQTPTGSLTMPGYSGKHFLFYSAFFPSHLEFSVFQSYFFSLFCI